MHVCVIYVFVCVSFYGLFGSSHTYICICVYVYMCVYKSILIHFALPIDTSYMHTSIHIFMYVYMCVFIYYWILILKI